jgi:alpha-L-rhamnosidase
VAGIGQSKSSVAFADLVLQPHLDPQMEWLSARYDSPRGLVALRWDHDDSSFRLVLEIPPGKPARLSLPGPLRPSEVMVDGKPAGEHRWAEVLSQSEDSMTLSLEPGRWEVSAPKR